MSQQISTSKLLPAAAVSGGIAALINAVLFFVLVPLLNAGPIMVQMGPPSPDTPFVELTVFQVIFASLIPAFAAAGVLWVLGRVSQRPFSIFRIVALVGLIASFAPFTVTPFTGAQVVVLGLMHVAAAAAIALTLDRRARA
jgi:hypothetical protein